MRKIGILYDSFIVDRLCIYTLKIIVPFLFSSYGSGQLHEFKYCQSVTHMSLPKSGIQ